MIELGWGSSITQAPGHGSREDRTDGRWCLMLGPRHNCLGLSQLNSSPDFSPPRGWGKHYSSLMGRDLAGCV